MAGRWRRRLRGLAGLGTVGAAIGASAGGSWFAVTGFLSGSFAPALVASAAVVYGVFGAFSATALGALLVATRTGRSLRDIGTGWAGLVGGVAGALFPLAINLWMVGSLGPLRAVALFLPIMARLGLLGATLTAGLVAVAKLEDRGALKSSDRLQLLVEERPS
jgi:uncharacterized membrane protein